MDRGAASGPRGRVIRLHRSTLIEMSSPHAHSASSDPILVGGGGGGGDWQEKLKARVMQFVPATMPRSWRPVRETLRTATMSDRSGPAVSNIHALTVVQGPRECVLVTCDEDPALGPDDCYLQQALSARGIRPVNLCNPELHRLEID